MAREKYFREYYKKNRETILAKNALRRSSNPEAVRTCRVVYYKKNRERIRARNDAYNKANPDIKSAYRARNRKRTRARMADYYQNNKEAIKAKVSRYKQENQAKVKEEGAKRRSRLVDIGHINQHEWYLQCCMFDHRCAYCGRRAKLTQDHVIPLAKGGRHEIDNVIPACGSCNSSKGSKYLKDWADG